MLPSDLEQQWQSLREEASCTWAVVSLTPATARDSLKCVKQCSVFLLSPETPVSPAKHAGTTLPRDSASLDATAGVEAALPSVFQSGTPAEPIVFRGPYRLYNAEPCLLRPECSAAVSHPSPALGCLSSSGAAFGSGGSPPLAVCFADPVEIRAEAACVVECLHFMAHVRVSGPGPVFFANCFFSEEPLTDRGNRAAAQGAAGAREHEVPSVAPPLPQQQQSLTPALPPSSHCLCAVPRSSDVVLAVTTSSEATTTRSGRWSASSGGDGGEDGVDGDRGTAAAFMMPMLGGKEAASKSTAGNSVRLMGLRPVGGGGGAGGGSAKGTHAASMAACQGYSMSAIDVSEETVCFLSQCDIYGGCSGSGLVCRDRCEVTVQDCSFSDASISWAAVELHNECTLRMHFTTISSILGCGLLCGDKSQVFVNSSEIRACGMAGAVATDSALLEMDNTGIGQSGSGTNISVSGTARCRLSACSFVALLPSSSPSPLGCRIAAADSTDLTSQRQLFRVDASTLTSTGPLEEDDGTRRFTPFFSSQSVVVVDGATLEAMGCEFLCSTAAASPPHTEVSVSLVEDAVSNASDGTALPPASVVAAGLLQRYHRCRYHLGAFLVEARLGGDPQNSGVERHQSFRSRTLTGSHSRKSGEWLNVLEIPTDSTDGSLPHQDQLPEGVAPHQLRQRVETLWALKGSLLALGGHPALLGSDTAVHVVIRDTARVSLTSNTFILPSHVDCIHHYACAAVLVDLLPFSSCPQGVSCEEDMLPQYNGRGVGVTGNRLPHEWCGLETGLNIIRYEFTGSAEDLGSSAARTTAAAESDVSAPKLELGGAWGLILSVPTPELTPGLYPAGYELDPNLAKWHAAVAKHAKSCEESWRRIELRWLHPPQSTPEGHGLSMRSVSVESGELPAGSSPTTAPATVTSISCTDVRNVGNIFLNVCDPVMDIMHCDPQRVCTTLSDFAETVDSKESITATYTGMAPLNVDGPDPSTAAPTPSVRPPSPALEVATPDCLTFGGSTALQTAFLNDEDAPPMRTLSNLQKEPHISRTPAVVFLEQLEDRSEPPGHWMATQRRQTQLQPLPLPSPMHLPQGSYTDELGPMLASCTDHSDTDSVSSASGENLLGSLTKESLQPWCPAPSQVTATPSPTDMNSDMHTFSGSLVASKEERPPTHSQEWVGATRLVLPPVGGSQSLSFLVAAGGGSASGAPAEPLPVVPHSTAPQDCGQFFGVGDAAANATVVSDVVPADSQEMPLSVPYPQQTRDRTASRTQMSIFDQAPGQSSAESAPLTPVDVSCTRFLTPGCGAIAVGPEEKWFPTARTPPPNSPPLTVEVPVEFFRETTALVTQLQEEVKELRQIVMQQQQPAVESTRPTDDVGGNRRYEKDNEVAMQSGNLFHSASSSRAADDSRVEANPREEDREDVASLHNSEASNSCTGDIAEDPIAMSELLASPPEDFSVGTPSASFIYTEGPREGGRASPHDESAAESFLRSHTDCVRPARPPCHDAVSQTTAPHTEAKASVSSPPANDGTRRCTRRSNTHCSRRPSALAAIIGATRAAAASSPADAPLSSQCTTLDTGEASQWRMALFEQLLRQRRSSSRCETPRPTPPPPTALPGTTQSTAVGAPYRTVRSRSCRQPHPYAARSGVGPARTLLNLVDGWPLQPSGAAAASTSAPPPIHPPTSALPESVTEPQPKHRPVSNLDEPLRPAQKYHTRCGTAQRGVRAATDPSAAYYVSSGVGHRARSSGSPTGGSALYNRYQRELDARTAWSAVLAESAAQERARARLKPHHQTAQVDRLYTQPMVVTMLRELNAEVFARENAVRYHGCTFHPAVNSRRPSSFSLRPARARAASPALEPIRDPASHVALPQHQPAALSSVSQRATSRACRPESGPDHQRGGVFRQPRKTAAQHLHRVGEQLVGRWVSHPPQVASNELAASEVHPYLYEMEDDPESALPRRPHVRNPVAAVMQPSAVLDSVKWQDSGCGARGGGTAASPSRKRLVIARKEETV